MARDEAGIVGVVRIRVYPLFENARQISTFLRTIKSVKWANESIKIHSYPLPKMTKQ